MIQSYSQNAADESNIINTLKNWPELVKKYTEASLQKSLTQIANTFIPFFALWIISYFLMDISKALAILICIINAFFLWRILIIQHDCSHLSFFKNKTANILIGNICSIFTLIPYKYRQTIHNLHHRYNGMLDDDVRDIGSIKTMNVKEYLSASAIRKVMYRISRHWISLLIIWPLFYFLIAQRIPLRVFKKWSWIIIQQMITTLIAAAIIYLVWSYVGRESFLFIHGITFYSFGVLTIWMFYVQHQHEHTYREYKEQRQYLLAALQWSSFYNLPYILHRGTWYIGYHHIHHLCMSIPNYNLKECHDNHPILATVTEKIDLIKSFKLINNFLRDEDKKRMITLRQYQETYHSS